MDREERKRVENEKEIDGTIEASLKYKNYDKKLNLRMLEEDTDEDESSSSSESSDSSSSSESSSDSSSKEYEDVSLNEAREHVLNKLRNKIKKKYVKGK
jgi:protein required for attachment to host cells